MKGKFEMNKKNEQIYELSREKITTFSQIEYLMNTHSFIDGKVIPLPEGGKPINKKQLAELLGTNPQTVSEWKTKGRKISKHYIGLICEYFKCDKDFLLCRQALPSVPDNKDFQKFLDSQYYELFIRLLLLNGCKKYIPCRVIDFLTADGIEAEHKFYYIDPITNERVTCSCIESNFSINDIVIQSGDTYKLIPYNLFRRFIKDILEYTEFRTSKIIQTADNVDIVELFR